MSKRANSAEALRGAISTEAAAPRTATPSSAPGTAVPRFTARTPSRVGKKTIAAHFDPVVSRQLKQIGIEHDRSIQDLLREAINDLFTKYGYAPIA